MLDEIEACSQQCGPAYSSRICDYSENPFPASLTVYHIDDLRVFASNNSETHRDRNHYTFKVRSLPRPRRIVTTSSSGLDFMVHQRAIRQSSSRVFPRTKRWIVMHVRESMWAYPLSNTSINPHHLLFHANVRECIWAYPLSNLPINPHHLLFHATFENASGQYPLSNTSVDPTINLVKRSDNSSNVSGRTPSSHWHAKERNITFVIERNPSLQGQIVAQRMVDPGYEGRDISFVCWHSTVTVSSQTLTYLLR